MKQKEVADFLGVGIAFVSAFETGRSKMPDYIAERLTNNLGNSWRGVYNLFIVSNLAVKREKIA